MKPPRLLIAALAFALLLASHAAAAANASPAPAPDDRGIRRVEILPGNVGYLIVKAFSHPADADRELAKAMHKLRHADALILDIRENAEPSPEAAALLAGYFFDAPTVPLFEVAASTGAEQRYATPVRLANKNAARPAYLLTSGNTRSAAVALAFVLQERHRAEIIGEPTAAANLRIISALTRKNWSGVRVVPDTRLPEADATAVAFIHALRQLIAQAPPGPHRDALQRQLDKVAPPSSIVPRIPAPRPSN